MEHGPFWFLADIFDVEKRRVREEAEREKRREAYRIVRGDLGEKLWFYGILMGAILLVGGFLGGLIWLGWWLRG